MRRDTILVCALFAMLLSSLGAGAQCLPVEAEACTLRLQGDTAPRSSSSCTGEAWSRHLTFTQPERFSDSNEDGWSETVLALRFPEDAGCACAVFRVHFADDPAGYPVHFGNSATNDGFGGDAGVQPTLNYAEAHLRGPNLQVFSGGKPGPVKDPLDPYQHHDSSLFLKLPALKDRVLEVEICDQAFDFAILGDEEPLLKGRMYTPLHAHSFVVNGSSTVFASFNRVIYRASGAPNKNRTGSGVERVELFLSP